MISPDGNLSSYFKEWNMDLANIQTDYKISQQDAEKKSIDFTGENSKVMKIDKKIVRPNGFWTLESTIQDNERMTWGTDPTCVWVVCLRIESQDLWIFYVDGSNGDIVGGDMAEAFYSDDI
jgi:hypothetical protein